MFFWGVHAADTSWLRFADPPVLVHTAAGVEWRAAADCAPPVVLASLIGARVGFAYDFNLDGLADATDSLGISPSECGEDRESGPGRIVLRRRLATVQAAVLRATLISPSGAVVDSHFVQTGGLGSMLRLSRFCAAPQNGEPEWIEVRNVTTVSVPLVRVKLEGRALSDTLMAGDSFVAGSDTAELRLWQPGARLVALSSWSSLRNSGDTLRLKRDGGLTLDSVMYGASAHPLADCVSEAGEGAAAAAAGYSLELSAPRWARTSTQAMPLTISVRAPAGGRYDLLVYDLDGRPLCALARGGEGPISVTFPPPLCPLLSDYRAGRVIILLAPHGAPSVRTLLRVAP
jgi:hypothetical protein